MTRVKPHTAASVRGTPAMVRRQMKALYEAEIELCQDLVDLTRLGLVEPLAGNRWQLTESGRRLLEQEDGEETR